MSEAQYIPVSEIIKDELKARKWTRVEFAIRFVVSFDVHHHGDIENMVGLARGLLDGTQEIDCGMAETLRGIFGVPAQVWLNMDSKYKKWLKSQN